MTRRTSRDVGTLQDDDEDNEDNDADDDDDNGDFDSIVTSRSQLQFQRGKKSHLIRIYHVYVCIQINCVTLNVVQEHFGKKSELIRICHTV